MRLPRFVIRIGGLAVRRVKGFVPTERILLNMDGTGDEPLEIPAEVSERVAAQYQQHDKGRAPANGIAYFWQRDRIDAGFQS